eukprot:gene30254-35242_t
MSMTHGRESAGAPPSIVASNDLDPVVQSFPGNSTRNVPRIKLEDRKRRQASPPAPASTSAEALIQVKTERCKSVAVDSSRGGAVPGDLVVHGMRVERDEDFVCDVTSSGSTWNVILTRHGKA